MSKVRLVENTKPHVRLLEDGHAPLMPGVNRVDEALWQRVKQWSTVKPLLEDRVLVERQLVPEGGLGKLAANDALDLLERTVDPRLLKDWAAADKRPAVQKAVQAQLRKVEQARGARRREAEEDEAEDPRPSREERVAEARAAAVAGGAPSLREELVAKPGAQDD